MKTIDVTALGEILIDFTPSGTDSSGDALLARKAGGAPVNLLATVAKFGGSTAFIGKVGHDIPGSFLRETVKKHGICDSGLVADCEHNTTLAFVELSSGGDRSFSFYRRYGADIFLKKEEVKKELIENAKIFHFGSLSLTAEPAKSATNYAIDIAKKAGCIISYDPNYRAPLWESEQAAIGAMKAPLNAVDILKISKEELEMLFGSDEQAAINAVFEKGVKLAAVTDGANGAKLFFKGKSASVAGAPAKTVDTTGAGDIFFGTFLSEFLKNGKTLDNTNFESAVDFLKKAVEVSAKSTEYHGAIAAIEQL